MNVFGFAGQFEIYNREKKITLSSGSWLGLEIYIWDLPIKHEKILNIDDYQRNANQNDNKVLPHTDQIVHHQKVYE